MAAVLWWPLAAWLSPATAWFIFFNAVVAAIAIMSGGASADRQTPSEAARRRLCRSGSSVVLDRLRSFSIFAVHPVAATAAPVGDDAATAAAAASESQFYCYGTREAEAAAAAAQMLAPEQPGRIRQAVAATAMSTAAPPAAPVALAQAEEDHAVAVALAPTEEDRAAPVAPAPENDEEGDKAEPQAEEKGDESISLDEAYALARRLRAQELASPSPTPAPATATVKVVPDGIDRRRTKAEEGKAELNARAELFIRQFREELKLQRLNSILSHTHALRSPTAAR